MHRAISPRSNGYDRVIFTEKCNSVFEVMLRYASQGLKWVA